MKSTNHIEQCIKQLKTSSSPEEKKRMFETISSKLDNQTIQCSRTIKPATWSIIMKSKLTKIAASLMILIGAWAGIHFLDNGQSKASVVFGQIKAALEKADWTHMKITGAGPVIEEWKSFVNQINIKNSDSKIVFEDYTDNKQFTYNKTENTITIIDISNRTFALGSNSFLEWLDKAVEQEKALGKTIEITKKHLENKNIDIITLVLTGENEHQKVVLHMDSITHLLIEGDVEYDYVSYDEPRIAHFKFDYPDTAPKDIYEAGAPKSAKILNLLPPAEVCDLIAAYKKEQALFPNQYAMVTIRNYDPSFLNTEEKGLASIIYCKGEKQQGTHYSIFEKPETYVVEMGTSFESAASWFKNNSNVHPVEIDLYTGLVHYETQFDFEKNRWSEINVDDDGEARINPLDIFQQFGWANSLYRKSKYSTPSTISVIENDYSKSHNLICIEELKQADDKLRNSNDLAMPPIRNLYYIDTANQYLCVRYEHHRVRNADWQIDKDWTTRIPEDRIRPDVVSIREIDELGQTSTGRLYPKTISETIDGIKGHFNFSFSIFLDDQVDIPEELFNPKNLTN